MPRPYRHWAPEAIYHVTIRGNDRQHIFLDAADYRQYLLTVHQSRRKWPYRLLAFALMPNHVHLVIQVLADASPSDAMQWLNVTYTRYFNDRHHRVGHLYQGRFYSNHIDRDTYAFEVTRYVHLNPVRARLVQHPLEYCWSSYRIYVGEERDALSLVDREPILRLFGETTAVQIVAYRQFVEEIAREEQAMVAHARTLRLHRLIPPRRWLREKVSEKVSGTFSCSKSA